MDMIYDSWTKGGNEPVDIMRCDGGGTMGTMAGIGT